MSITREFAQFILKIGKLEKQPDEKLPNGLIDMRDLYKFTTEHLDELTLEQQSEALENLKSAKELADIVMRNNMADRAIMIMGMVKGLRDESAPADIMAFSSLYWHLDNSNDKNSLDDKLAIELGNTIHECAKRFIETGFDK